MNWNPQAVAAAARPDDLGVVPTATRLEPEPAVFTPARACVRAYAREGGAVTAVLKARRYRPMVAIGRSPVVQAESTATDRSSMGRWVYHPRRPRLRCRSSTIPARPRANRPSP